MNGAAVDSGITRLDAVCAEHETLLRGCTLPVADATAYTDIDALNPLFGHHLRTDIYTERTCQVAPVILARLDAGTVLHGGGEFLVTSRGRLLAEQFPPYLRSDPARVQGLRSQWRPVVAIPAECVLIARFGIFTWGHWLGELLPKLLLVEARYPGRFRYVLPAQVLVDANPDLPWLRIKQSLLAYGVQERQVLSVRDAMDYRFDRLYAVGDVWSDHVMHPAAAAMLRDRLPAETQHSSTIGQRIALRRVGDGRMLSNPDEVERLLADKGFVIHTVGRMSFQQQVDLFRSAAMVFGILGSDLTGLLYAREGVKLISVAPATFGDRFFYALLLDRKGRYADLRGAITEPHRSEEARSRFRIDASQIDAAMLALGEESGHD